jgi:hypothetical protein
MRRDQGRARRVLTQLLVGPPSQTHPGRADGEPVRVGLVGQPLSTISCVAYLVAGWWLWRRRGRCAKPVLAGAYAVATAANGLGGIAFHGPGDRLSRAMHDTALCATAGVLVASVPRHRPAPDAILATVGVFGGAVVAHRVARPTSRLHVPAMSRAGHAAWHALTALTLAVWGRSRFAPLPEKAAGESPPIHR